MIAVLTGASSIVALDSPAGIGESKSLAVAGATLIIEIDGILEPIALAAKLRVEADVDNTRLASLDEGVGGCGDASSGEGKSKKTGGELHFDGW
jgi:hypothetical protein